jgi:hypothetical protein
MTSMLAAHGPLILPSTSGRCSALGFSSYASTAPLRRSDQHDLIVGALHFDAPSERKLARKRDRA